MAIYQQGAADGAITGLSFAFSAIRLGKLGIAVATVKNFNTTRAAFEILGVEMPTLIDAVSTTFGGEMKGSNILSMGLNEEGLYKAADIVNLLLDIKSIFKGTKKVNHELIEGVPLGLKDGMNVLKNFSNNKPKSSEASRKNDNNNSSSAETATLSATKKKVKEANEY